MVLSSKEDIYVQVAPDVTRTVNKRRRLTDRSNPLITSPTPFGKVFSESPNHLVDRKNLMETKSSSYSNSTFYLLFYFNPRNNLQFEMQQFFTSFNLIIVLMDVYFHSDYYLSLNIFMELKNSN